MNCLRVGLLALALLVAACGESGGSYDSSAESGAVPADAASTQGEELLDANTASDQSLQEATSETVAAHIVAHRPFTSLGDLYSKLADEIGEETAEETRKTVFIPVELNSASDEDILAIPGVGSRMLHEFKEYRPYESMAQFEREVGKYVDDEELARLVRYVTL